MLETVAQYTSSQYLIFYVIILVFLSFIYLKRKWSNKARSQIKVLERLPDGGTATHYVPRTGNYVTLQNPETGKTRTWPISEVCMLETDYPGDGGFIPKFLLERIKTVIVISSDWEPLLNFGAYASNVSSPDVKEWLYELAKGHPEIQEELEDFVGNLATAPTRELIGSPELLGNVMVEQVTRAIVTISKELWGEIENVMRRLDRSLSPTAFYIGIGIVAVGIIYVVYQVSPLGDQVKQLVQDVASIKQSLGIQ